MFDQAQTGGIRAAQPSELCVIETPHAPNSADSMLALVLTEAFMLAELEARGTAGSVTSDDATRKYTPDCSQDGTLAFGSSSVLRHECDYFGSSSVTVLIGKDAVLLDFLEIGRFNGVEMMLALDLPHDRTRPPRRGRGIPRVKRRLKSQKKKIGMQEDEVVRRIALGRRS